MVFNNSPCNTVSMVLLNWSFGGLMRSLEPQEAFTLAFIPMASPAGIVWVLFTLSVICSGAIPGFTLHEKREVPLSHFDERQRISRDVLLPMRIGLKQNENSIANAESWLMSVSDPDSKSYGRFWAQTDIVEAFGPATSLLRLWPDGFPTMVYRNSRTATISYGWRSMRLQHKWSRCFARNTMCTRAPATHSPLPAMNITYLTTSGSMLITSHPVSKELILQSDSLTVKSDETPVSASRKQHLLLQYL